MILAQLRFNGEQKFSVLEVSAQLCALHVRKRLEFNRHAFLLSFLAVRPLPPKIPNGIGRFEGRLNGVSQRAFSYDVKFKLESTAVIKIKLIIGTSDYGKMFEKEKLRPYYQELFALLCRCHTKKVSQNLKMPKVNENSHQ
jgi:hypothetical protein